MLVSALLMALLCPPKRAAAALVATHLNFAHGVSRKCTHARGTLGDRPGALLLYANRGEFTETEASSTSGGFCTFVAPAVAGEGNSYDVGVSALNFQSQMGKYEGRNGHAFNWVSPCHYDYVYFRLYRAGGGFYWGSVRACQFFFQGHGVVHTLGGSWYDMKVRASPSEAVLYRRRNGDGQWYEVQSRATNGNFNNRLIPRSALVIRNGFDNMAFFDAWYILTDAASVAPPVTVTTTTTTTTGTTTTTTTSSTMTSTSTSSTTSTTEPSTTTTSSSTTSSTSTSTTTTTTTPWLAGTTITTSTTTSNYLHALLQGLVAKSKEEDTGGGAPSWHAVVGVALLVVAVLVAVLSCFRRGTVSVAPGPPSIGSPGAGPLETTKEAPPGVGTGSSGSGGGAAWGGSLRSLAMAPARGVAPVAAPVGV